MKKLLVNPIILFSATNQGMAECSEFVIYIAIEKIVAAKLTVAEWKEMNAAESLSIDNYICNETETTITVDLVAMESGTVNVAKWLSTNTNFIDFGNNYNIIEKAHLLDPSNSEALEYINETENNIDKFYFESMSLSALREKYGIDIDKPSYDTYIEVKKISNPPAADQIGIAAVSKYNPNSFSSPLISAIVFKNVGQSIELAQYSNCHFLFTILSNTKVILKLTYKGKSSYYDYSQDPRAGAL